MFKVYDINSGVSSVMSYHDICNKYKSDNLILLNEDFISSIHLYSNGKKSAFIQRIEEVPA